MQIARGEESVSPPAVIPPELDDGTGNGSGDGTGGGSGDGGEGGGAGAGELPEWIKYTGNSPNRYFYLSDGSTVRLQGTHDNGYAGSDPLAATIQRAYDVAVGRHGYSSEFIRYENGYAFLKKSFLGLDTGGYTGDWDGGDGKLAMLHAKELVLNADDTENFLAAIELIHAITQAIDLRAATQAATAGITAPDYNKTQEVLEQQVTIHAEFPNATSHSEIEEAFNNLINRASQYAGRISSV